MVFMLRVCSTHCKLFEMILTSSDPQDLKWKRLEKDKLCEEESRLAWMDLEVLMEARTKGCIEMSEIIILLLSFLKIPGLMLLPSVWELSNGRLLMQEREKEKENFGMLWRYIVHFILALSSLHQALSDPKSALVFAWSLVSLFGHGHIKNRWKWAIKAKVSLQKRIKILELPMFWISV